jgi:hypothetical protein
MNAPARPRGLHGRGYGLTVALAAASIGLLISGCAGLPGGPLTPRGGNDPAEIVDGYDCLAPNLDGWVDPPEFPGNGTPDEPAEPTEPPHPDAPPAGRVPEGFEPVVAVRCNLMDSLEDAQGRWSAVAAETLAGNLGPLLTALDQPDDAQWLGPCTADMELVPPLWLADATGRAIRVHYPVTGCGKTKPAVREALAGLTLAGTVTEKRQLTQPRAAIDAGCDVEWMAPTGDWPKLMAPLGTLQNVSSPVPHEPEQVTPGVTVNPGVTISPASPPSDPTPGQTDGMRWCRYATQPVVPGTEAPQFEGSITLQSGRFVSGGTLNQGDAGLVLAAANDAPHNATTGESCGLASVAFIVLWPLWNDEPVGSPLTAQLDGCRLLYRDGSDPRPLPADLHRVLEALPTS